MIKAFKGIFNKSWRSGLFHFRYRASLLALQRSRDVSTSIDWRCKSYCYLARTAARIKNSSPPRAIEDLTQLKAIVRLWMSIRVLGLEKWHAA